MVTRLPRAPAVPPPEFAEFLAPLVVHFVQQPSARVLERYVSGLLTDHPNKNCDTLAQVVPGTSEQQLQHLLTDMAWDAEDLNRQRVEQMLALESEGDAVLILDDLRLRLEGHVRRYVRTVAGPVDAKLYVPQGWTSDADRRARAHVPADVAFQTKPEIALALLDEARAWGVPHACVTVDADYGDKPPFLNGLEARAERYVVAVAATFTVATTRGGAPGEAGAVLAAEAPSAWVTLSWREGSRGRERAKFRALRAWRVDGDGTRHVGWLIGQRPARAQHGDPKWRYFWSNFPAGTPLDRLVEYAHRRWWIEQFHEEAKQLLGWDQSQGRRYDAFHRHTIAVMLSYSFLVWLEWQERQHVRRRGRTRRRFSPSAGSAPPLAAARPPRGGGLAPPSGAPHADPGVPAPPQLSAPTLTKQY